MSAAAEDRCSCEICPHAPDKAPPALQQCRCGAKFCGEDCWIISWHFGHRQACPNAAEILAAAAAAQPRLPGTSGLPATSSLRERAEQTADALASVMARAALGRDDAKPRSAAAATISRDESTATPTISRGESVAEASPSRPSRPAPADGLVPQTTTCRPKQQSRPRQDRRARFAAAGDDAADDSNANVGPVGRAVTRPRAEDPPEGDPDEAADVKEVLMLMGFTQSDVEGALRRCSSVEAAIEFLMLRSGPGSAAKSPGFQPIPEVTKKVDLAGQIALGQMAQPWLPRTAKLHAESGPGGKRLSAHAQAAAPHATSGPLSQQDLVQSLREVGFSESQAKAAALRCSSAEAAVEWLTAHPEQT